MRKSKDGYTRSTRSTIGSMKNKVISLSEYLTEKNIIACGITETWLGEHEEVVEQECEEL